MSIRELVKHHFSEVLLSFLLALLLALGLCTWASWTYVYVPFAMDVHGPAQWLLSQIENNAISFSENQPQHIIHAPFELVIRKETKPSLGVVYYAHVFPTHRTDRQVFVPYEGLEFVILSDKSGTHKIVFERLLKQPL